MNIYLVVMCDRHCDNQYAVRNTPEAAKIVADNFMASYENRYQWTEIGVVGWHYFHKADVDDGPSVHIEELELP